MESDAWIIMIMNKNFFFQISIQQKDVIIT